MEIKEALNSLVQKVEGGIASVVISMEGEAIDCYSKEPGFDVEWIGARYGLVVRDILSTVSRLNQGVVRSIVLELQKAILVVTPLKDLFFLVLLVHQDGNLGQALFQCRILAPALEEELSI